jgi:uncharacterized protein (UPF0548 family)
MLAGKLGVGGSGAAPAAEASVSEQAIRDAAEMLRDEAIYRECARGGRRPTMPTAGCGRERSLDAGSEAANRWFAVQRRRYHRRVFYLGRPADATVGRALERARHSDFNYRHVGATKTGRELPTDFVVDRYGCDLGSGAHAISVAKRAVENFVMYPVPWTRVVAPAGIALGAVFGTLIRHLGFWSLNPCRIIDVVNESSESRKAFGFAFGTLEGHAERGEERFEVTWERESDVVRYDVVAFSRPAELLTRIGAPIARRYQLRFHRESCRQMRAAMDLPAAP